MIGGDDGLDVDDRDDGVGVDDRDDGNDAIGDCDCGSSSSIGSSIEFDISLTLQYFVMRCCASALNLPACAAFHNGIVPLATGVATSISSCDAVLGGGVTAIAAASEHKTKQHVLRIAIVDDSRSIGERYHTAMRCAWRAS